MRRRVPVHLSPTRRAASALAFAAAVLVLGAGAARVWPGAGETFEFCHYGEIAENLLSGQGFVTRTFYPFTLAYLVERHVAVPDAGPVVDRFPLQAALVAASERVLGRGDAAVTAANVAAHALWVALLFWFGAGLAGAPLAALAAGLWALNPMMLDGFDLHGHADVLFGALMVPALALYSRWLGRGEARDAGRAGLCLGLGYLSRYSATLMLPVLLLAARRAPRGRRAAGLACFAAGFLACALPWALRNRLALGSASPPLLLWNLAQDTVNRVGIAWMDYKVYRLSDFTSAAAVAALARKWVSYAWLFLRRLPFLWYGLPLFPFAAWATWRAEDLRLRRFLRLSAALLIWTAACFSFLRYEDLWLMNGRYYLWFATSLTLGAAAGLAEVGRGRLAPWLAPAVIAATACWWGYAAAQASRGTGHPSGLAVARWPEVEYLREHPLNGWLVTNLPAQLTWYANARTVALPNVPGDVKRIARDYPVAGVFLSFHRVGEWNAYPVWRAVLGGYDGGIARLCKELGLRVEKRFDAGVLLLKAPS